LPVNIAVGDASGNPGRTVGFAVSIDTQQQNVVRAEVCIDFDPLTPINADVDVPDCDADESLDGAFIFEPEGCTPLSNCARVCAAVTGDRIRNGAMLFSCRVAIASGATPDNYPLICSDPVAIDPDDNRLDATCTDGTVIVETNLTGDCNGDGMVTINELIIGVNIALGNLPIASCPAFDTDRNGQVSIDELIQAVNNALNT
jgi:hypothetical protein